MDRGDGIIRWSPNRTRDEFLSINVNYRILQLHKPTGQVVPEQFDYEDVAKYTDFQGFGTYDWSPSNPGLVALGTKSGEVHLLRVDDGSNDSMILPLKLQRTCQAVAFNTTGLLAVGLDRVRNDQCLHIWDINQRLANWDPSKKGWQTPPFPADPLHKLEASVAITSTRWFEDQPQTLVVGVKNQSVRIHDLRDPNGAVISFQTRCNNNLAIDHRDPNYFASSSLDSPAIMIWDRRATSRQVASKMYNDTVDSSDVPWGCALKLNRVIDPKYDTNIRSLRYCRDQRGLLAVLSSAGELQLICTEKEHIEPMSENDTEGSPELLEVKRSHDLQYPYFNEDFGYSHDDRIVSFDWVTLGSSYYQPRVITRRSNHKMGVILKPSMSRNLVLDLMDFSSRAKHTSRGAVPKFSDEKEREAVLKPLLESQKRKDIEFGPDGKIKKSEPPLSPTSPGTTSKFDTVLVAADESSMARSNELAGKGLDGLLTGRILSSRERHEQLFSRKSNDLGSKDALPDRINSQMIARIKQGYLFNCQRNADMLMVDPWLKDVWVWIDGAEAAAAGDGMVSGPLNLAYMGVQSIWNNDLGSKYISRLTDPTNDAIPSEEEWGAALADINKKAGRGLFKSVPTKRPHHRQMCLAICGWGKSPAELEQDLLNLEAKGQYTVAAAWALFEKNPKRAVESLKRGGKNLLFIGLALSLQVKGNPPLKKEEWDYNMSDLSDMADDPYLRAIYTLISTGDWRAIANEASLPLRDRVGVALHNFDDTEFPNWLNRQTAEVVRTGDIEGLVLTGITDSAVSLLSAYIEKFGDYQTATLIIHFAAPLYIDDFRVWQWRADYQDLHNKNRLFVDRCRFDVQSTKKSRDRDGFAIIKPRPRQVTLRCMHCDTAFTNDLDNTGSNASTPKASAASASGDRNPLYSSGVHAGISCPKCGRHLPRCGICLLTLGMPRSDKDRVAVEPYQRLANFMSFCMKCDHAFHADHARGWFKVHNECPIPECHCACNADVGGMGSRDGEEDRKSDGAKEEDGSDDEEED
ncbi:hypothetical protein VF21_02154 [Pseudogymnoascus sp. 05NY08]|nr:hypothetical protein VF21_02154 [Pseudogymnoascus sp. 05NY08]